LPHWNYFRVIKMNYLPDEFEVKYVFFGLGGSNKLSLKGDMLLFEYHPDLPKHKSRKLVLAPLRDEWLFFWSKMEDIGAWQWKERYEPPENMYVDGDITDIKISYQDKNINTYCWCNAPPRLVEFYEAVYKLTDLHIDSPGGLGRG
jgi:hypothetical protein